MNFSVPLNWREQSLQLVSSSSRRILSLTVSCLERRNVKIIQQSTATSQNPYLLSEQEEKQTLRKHDQHRKRLRVPRRPLWNKTMTTSELDKQEKAAFLDWRRGLAECVRHIP